ncbi:MAG: hypothetical protein COX57_10145 [Alphaproteobacteria bacterium CG_4_10_14_0_2_um_filter_63_37]|nr:MAG: hypothetical protein AUJ55_04170 [Proteobacteria bacterium CG1_02_64_396]PJA24140.1 MAG: hypothetical protein COX57_10145 [Alphaproteobacteria bacterium CG_4_10_14_0_2_um_filter_63_37]
MSGKTLKVMLVDDEPIILDIVGRFLKQLAQEKGFRVELSPFKSSVEALFDATSGDLQYGLILLDVRMGEMMGTDLFTSLMATHPQIIDRTLFITAFEGDLESIADQYPIKVLAKPFRYEQFREAVLGVLARRNK